MLNSAIARRPDRLEDRRHEAEAFGEQRVQPLPQRCRVDPKGLFQPLRIDAGDQLLQPAQILRQPADEIGELRDHDRDDDDQRQRQHDDEGEQDQYRRHDPRQADPLQPVGDRIEEIGKHHAGHERQQDVAEDIEQDRDDDGGDRSRSGSAGETAPPAPHPFRDHPPGIAPSPLPVMCLSQATR